MQGFIIIVNGGWSDWSDWSSCSTTCGDGVRSQTRTCNNPTPTAYGEECTGTNVTELPCSVRECPCKYLSTCKNKASFT